MFIVTWGFGTSGAKPLIHSDRQHIGHTDLRCISGSCGESEDFGMEVTITRGFI